MATARSSSTLSIDGERAPGDLQRLGVPPFVPPEEPEASKRAAQQRGVPALVADPERGAQGPVGGVEPLEQRREVALPQVDFRQPRRASVARKLRDQRVDDLPVDAPEGPASRTDAPAGAAGRP